MKKMIKIITCTLIFLATMRADAYRAVVISPIADLVAEPMAHLTKRSHNHHTYDRIPMCGGSHNPFEACPRTHQLRANEIVEVVKELGDDVKIRITSCFYLCPRTHTHQHIYWMHKKDLIPHDTLAYCKKQYPLPEPINDETKKIPQCITLAQPWLDTQTQTLFSAGTRFKAYKTGRKQHHIFVFDPIKKEYVISVCPTSHCIPLRTMTPKQQRKLMVSLARAWAQHHDGFVPYVWGGCSIGHKIKCSHAYEHELKLTNGKKTTYYEWPDQSHGIKAGIDCSNLILLAAQSAGIPYFCKNSYTVEQTLHPLEPMDSIEIGDIIWTRGHVMIVADLEKNTLIEARHYAHGYGKVHEIPLATQFKGMYTYDMLRAYYKEDRPVQRIDKDSNVRATMHIKIFKLM